MPLGAAPLAGRDVTCDVASSPLVSVLLHDEQCLETLEMQGHQSVQLLTCEDEAWHERAAGVARARSWPHVRASSPTAAIGEATAEFLIDWHVYSAAPEALGSLVAAATEHADMCGSVAANFDPAILWRRDELAGPTGRIGLAQAEGLAIDRGCSSGLMPRRR